MKITFIYLPHPYLKQPDAQAPLGLMYLSSILERNNYDVSLKNYSSWIINEAIADLEQADVYGITATSLEVPMANIFSKMIKEKYPSSKILIGGPGTVTPEYIDRSVIDSVVTGEAENIIISVLNDVLKDKLAPTYHGTPVTDLDTIPMPARHMLNGSGQGGNIFAFNKSYHDGGSTVILTSRGCPYHCAFCSSRFIGNRNVRFRSPQNVYDEIKHVVDTYNIRQFRISDDMFTASPKRSAELCELIGPLGISWRISTRTKPIDTDLLKLMRQAGCKEISFGVESFDNHVLEVLKKGLTARDSAKALKAAANAGIKTRILFMIRTPGQTKDTVAINMKWLDSVPYNIICCTTFVPLPGSDIWNNPDAYGIKILTKDLNDYNFYFFSKHGENKLNDVISINGRSLEEVNSETLFFKDYLKSTGRLNYG